jgi:ATP-binding cassette subfamily F protein 3
MLTAQNILIQYGDRILLDHVNLVVKPTDKLGLVGRNGAGKSTLLKVLAGETATLKGDVSKPGNTTLAFLHQDISIPQQKSVIDETLLALEELLEVNKKLDHINHELTYRTDYESDSYMEMLENLSALTERFSLLGGDKAEGEAVRVLQGLGFSPKDLDRKVAEFSGGWQMRIVLAKMLLQKPDFLLLDEPTNHLDIESIMWLENFLRSYPGAVIIVSHDQMFLDNVTNRTVEITLGSLHDYNANYSKYLELRVDRKEKMESAFRNQQKVLAEKERTIERFMAKATKTKMAQSMKKQLDKIERIELEEEDIATMNIRFPPAPRSGEIVVEAVNADKSYGALEVLNDVNFKIERGDRIAFVGQNGQGKTTLAKMLVKKLKATHGEIKLGYNVSIGYYAQNQAEELGRDQTLLETMEMHSPPEMRTKLRSILGAFMFSGEDHDKKVSVLSGGERARLALACLLLQPFNFLVFDEPTNHLDILSKEVLKHALIKYDGTLLVVSHDRKFLEGMTDKTIEFRDRQIFEYLGDVEYYLAKRSLEDMRQAEIRKATIDKTETTDTRVTTKNDSDQRKIEKEIKNIEAKIEQLESQARQLETTMAQDGFYDSANATTALDKYKILKAEIKELTAEWEEKLELI